MSDQFHFSALDLDMLREVGRNPYSFADFYHGAIPTDSEAVRALREAQLAVAGLRGILAVVAVAARGDKWDSDWAPVLEIEDQQRPQGPALSHELLEQLHSGALLLASRVADRIVEARDILEPSDTTDSAAPPSAPPARGSQEPA